MIDAADVVIVGAGVYGLASAYWLAERERGVRVLVLDEGEFASGGSGRNGAGFRMQWGLEFNIRLSQESIAFFEDIESRLDYPGGIDLKQRGYLLLAHGDAMLKGFRDNHARQREFGVPSELLDVDDCLRLAPGLNAEGLSGGAFCAKDGTASPFLYLDALLKACRRLGVEIRFRTRVHDVTRQDNAFVLDTSCGIVHAGQVLVCTDWAASELLKPLGVDLPITGMPKEAMVTEACAPALDPCVVSFKHDMFVNQVARGNFVIVPTRIRPDGDDMSSTAEFLPYAARTLLDLLPKLHRVNVLRSWAGVISKTPDMQAVIGETDVEGLFVAVSAYKGFMTSPAVGRIMCELILDGHSNHPAVAPLGPRRFATGELVPEPLTV